MQRNLPSEKPIEASGTDPVGGSADRSRTALIVLSRTASSAALVRVLAERGFSVRVEIDVERALEFCRDKPPDLVVVDDILPSMMGSSFIAEALKISWTTASILITDKDEMSVHERTEGLGVLGHIKSFDDIDSLETLLEKLVDMAG